MFQGKFNNKLKNIDPKSVVISLAILVAVVVGFSNFLTGNVAKTNSFYIDKGHYFSTFDDSQCKKSGGMAFILGGDEVINENVIKLLRISNDVAIVSVDGRNVVRQPGHEKYVNGLYITLFASGKEDACLIVTSSPY